MNFYKRYPGDYGKDTAHLSLIEHGAYTILLDTIYSTERPLPKNPAGLFRVCRGFSEEEQEAILSVIDQFFIETDDGYIHPRVEKELDKANLLRDKARENGSKGGRPSKKSEQKPSGKPDKNPAGFDGETQRDKNTKANQTPDTRHITHSSGKPSECVARENRATIVDLPDWIDQAKWIAFIDHRKAMRKKLTIPSALGTLEQLARARSFGHNPNELLDAAVANGWQGCVFPDKHYKTAGTQQRGKSGVEQWLEDQEAQHATA